MNNSDRINAEVTRCLDIAAVEFRRTFPRPTVDYHLRGRVGGTAAVRRWHVSLNGGLLCANPDTVIGQTLPHEIAHLIDFAMHPWNFEGSKRRLHGPTWKAIMRLFGVPPERCHSMDTTLTRVRVVRRHLYRCAICGADINNVSAHAHKRIQFGVSTYWSRRCKHRFGAADYVGLAPDTVRVLEARHAAQSAKR